MVAKYAQELKSFVTSLDEWKVSSDNSFKGLVLNNGTVHTWPLSECPYHETYMHRNNIYPDMVRSYHDINGDDHYSTRQEDKELVAQALNLKPEQSWAFAKVANELPEVHWGTDTTVPSSKYNWSWRRPLLHLENTNKLFIGQPGTHHDQLYTEFRDPIIDELHAGGKISHGYWSTGSDPEYNDPPGQLEVYTNNDQNPSWAEPLRRQLNQQHGIPDPGKPMDWNFSSVSDQRH